MTTFIICENWLITSVRFAQNQFELIYFLVEFLRDYSDKMPNIRENNLSHGNLKNFHLT